MLCKVDLTSLTVDQNRLSRYMELIDSDLERSISKNFDFFNRAFHNIDEIKGDVRQVAEKSKSIQNATKQLKIYQLINMVKVAQKTRKK